MITIETTVDGTEKTLTYYSKDVIDELYTKYNAIKDVYPDYALSIKNFLETTYTDSTAGNGEILVPTFSVTSTTKIYKYDNEKDIKGKEEKIEEDGMTYTVVNYEVVSAKYGTPVEFLMDLIEITGSQDFVNAFIDEVTKPEYKITLNLYDLTTVTTKIFEETYMQATTLKRKIDGKVYTVRDSGIMSLPESSSSLSTPAINTFTSTFDMGPIVEHTETPSSTSGKIIIKAEGSFGDEGHTYTLYCNDVAIKSYVLSTDKKDIATWEVDSPENSQYLATKSDESEVSVITTEIITEKGYDLQVKEVKCWWADIVIDNEISVDTQIENIDEADSIDSDIIDKLINGAGIEGATEKILEKVTNESSLVSQSFIYKNDSEIFKESDIKETNTGEPGFLNSIYNYIKDNKDSKYMKKTGETNDDLVGTRGYDEINKAVLVREGIDIDLEVYDTMDVIKDNRKQKWCEIKQTKSVTYGIPSGKYDLSSVLALLRDSSGDPVEYRDIYDRKNSGNSTIAPGEMLVNGAEMIFQLLDSSENTEGLSDVMRYLLYLYSGKDYGVTSENFGMFSDLSFTGTTPVLTGNTIQEKVWFGLKSMGFSDISVAAAMGNIHYESGTFNPEAVESGYNENDGGIGICQWTNSPRKSGNGRNAQLQKYAKKKDTTWKDPDVQAEFLMAELTPGGGADGCATYQLMNSTYTGSSYEYNDWKNAKDTEALDNKKLKELTEIFMFTFERPNASAGKNSLNSRYEYALMYYNMYHGKSLSGGTEGESDTANGVTARFTSNITGKTFTVWKQGSVGLSGQCNRAAAASIASGYRASGESENSVLNSVKAAGDCVLSNASSTQNFFDKYGLKAQINTYSYNTTNIKNFLTNGKYICLWINMEGSGKEGIGKSGTRYCNLNGIHWIAIIGYNSKDGKEQIYVADPGGFSGATGWHDLDEFNVLKNYIKYFTVISEKK